jgi:DNA-binding transcriptional ArsR family regulator/precorrin-6B methylase 2
MRMRAYIEDVLDILSTAPARWELYKTLAEPIRLRLLALAAEEELAVGELAELLGEGQPNISRHASTLKQAGLLRVRKEGARSLLKLDDASRRDPVVVDALTSGRLLCERDGSLARVPAMIAARDALGREFFAKPRADQELGSGEFATYLSAFSLLLPARGLAVDVGTGDGGLLAALAPCFERVIGVDRSEAQLALARTRVESLGLTNVRLECAALEDMHALAADVVFAVRLLHHAPKPEDVLAKVAAMAKPGGAVIVLDYAPHDDESMRTQSDLWLGFTNHELLTMAHQCELSDARVAPIPAPTHGADAHLPWHALVARRATKNPKQ